VALSLHALLAGKHFTTSFGAASGQNMVSHLMHVEAIDVLRAAMILIAAIVAAMLLKWAVRRWLHKGNCEVGISELIARFVGYGVVMLGIVYALMALHVQVGPLVGALGVGGLAIALASKGILEDLFGGFVLQARRPFHRGDEVQLGDQLGIVEDVNLRTVVLRTHDGERVFVPSSTVLSEQIVNLTANGARRSILIFTVPFAADIERTTCSMARAAQGADGVHAEPAVEAQVRRVGESGVEIAVKFWHGPTVAAQHRATDAVASEVMSALAAHGIAHEVPQRRVLVP
jgi:small-conductance mechanosensitive channel